MSLNTSFQVPFVTRSRYLLLVCPTPVRQYMCVNVLCESLLFVMDSVGLLTRAARTASIAAIPERDERFLWIYEEGPTGVQGSFEKVDCWWTSRSALDNLLDKK